MMKTLQNIWKHKREFQINNFMVIGIDKLEFDEENYLYNLPSMV